MIELTASNELLRAMNAIAGGLVQLAAAIEKAGPVTLHGAEPAAERASVTPPLAVERTHVPSPQPAPVSSSVAAPAAPIPKASPPGSAAPPRAGFHIGAETPAPAAAPAPIAAGATSPAWATEARTEILHRLYPTAAPPVAILTALRASRGPAVPSWGVVSGFAATVLKTKRPLASGPPSAFTRAMQAPKDAPDVVTPFVTDFDTIRMKAATWGIQMDSRADLERVNAHARHIGHRPFEFEGPRKSIISNRGSE